MALQPHRGAFAWACMLTLAMLLGGCGAADQRAELRFWTLGREGEIAEQLMAEFHRRHPDIRVVVQRLPMTGAHQKLLTAFAADATPDLAQLGNTWVPEFAAIGALDVLDGRIVESPGIDPDDYFPGIWDTNVIDGRVYGLPWYVDTRLLFYRRDLLASAGFHQPPRDWQQWRASMAALKRQAGAGGYAILLPLNEYEPLQSLALQQSGAMLRDDDTRGNFSGEGFRQALAFYLEIFGNDWAPAVANTQIANVWAEFGRGYFAYYISGPWNIAEFRRRLPAEQQDHWMTAPLPGPTGIGASNAGGSSLVVFERSANKDAAWKLVEYLSEPESQLRMLELAGSLPPRRSVWTDPRLTRDAHVRAFGEQLEHARATPKVPEWERIANELRLVAEQAVRGGLDLDAAVAELDRRSDGILAKRRWMVERQQDAVVATSAAAAP